LESFELLAEAVRQRKIVTFWYRKHGQLNLTRKRVHPYHIAYVNNRWTLFAFDPKERGMRKFVLFRLTRPEVTSEKFTVATNFDLNKELAGSFGLYKGEREMEVVVDFDAWGADDVRGRNWHASMELTELPKGCLRVKMKLNSLEEVEGWVLGFGAHATVIEPAELRERVRKTVRAVEAKCGKSDELDR
jgi:predicted DNA-binding transcriptional regulator YafY